MPMRRRGHSTRQSLLEACCEVFASKGYHDATVAEICKEAGANIAALNYYFGDKANAYREAWQYAFDEDVRSHPLDGEDPVPDAPALQRLHAHVESLLLRMNDDGRKTIFGRLREWEVTRPSGLIDQVDHEVREKSRQHLLACIRELIGQPVRSEVLELCEESILAQCRCVLPFNRRESALLDNRRIDARMIRKLSDHIVAFSCAGLAAYRTANSPVARRPRMRSADRGRPGNGH
jgi:AcrR family transcriptional regulator